MSEVPQKRFQAGLYEALSSLNRLAGSGGGSGIIPLVLGYAAAGNQGNYSTANAATWTDITNTTFSFNVSRPLFIMYLLIPVSAHLSAAGALGYVRGNIVGYDTTAGIEFGTTGTTSGPMLYIPIASGKGLIQPATYSAKLQAATDNNTFSITVDQFFHVILGF